MGISVGKRGPNPRFSPPRPRIFRDGEGMGTWYENALGTFWGRGWLENWGFLGFYPRKSPKIIWGYFGVSSPTNPKIDWYNSCFPQKSRGAIAIAPLALLQRCPWIRSKGNHTDRDGSSVGKRVPIPIYPHPHPGFLGKEQGHGLKTDRGFFGDGDNPKFGDLLGFIPKNPQILGMGTGLQLLKCLGTLWGRGNPKFRGFLGEKPRKSPNFGVGTGEEISGIFPTLPCT